MHLISSSKFRLVVATAAITFVMSACFRIHAKASARISNSNDLHAKRAGNITQLESVYDDGLPSTELPIVANATIISPCLIITNYHVAFGKSQNAATKQTTMIQKRVKGHVVNFAFGLDEATGQFKRSLKAKVIGFGNYVESRRGMLGDLALLELETCLDKSEFEQLDLSMAESTEDVPVGSLKTVSAFRDSNGRNHILIQEGCLSFDATPVDGLFIATCEAAGGMSGSAVYEIGKDKKWHWTGLTMVKSSDRDGHNILIAINAKTIASFLKKIPQFASN